MQAKCELFKNEVEDGVGWLKTAGLLPGGLSRGVIIRTLKLV